MSTAQPAAQSKIRVVVAKPGLDGHDRGAKIIARALRDAGMEVIYTGLHQTPEQIVETVIQEDADAVGLSICLLYTSPSPRDRQGQAHRVGVLLDDRLDHLLGGLVQAGVDDLEPVSYTHLTLPTNREV